MCLKKQHWVKRILVRLLVANDIGFLEGNFRTVKRLCKRLLKEIGSIAFSTDDQKIERMIFI